MKSRLGIHKVFKLSLTAACLAVGASNAPAQSSGTTVYIDALWQRVHLADSPHLILKNQKQTMTLGQADQLGYRLGEYGQSGRNSWGFDSYQRQYPVAEIPDDVMGVAEVRADGVLKWHVHGCHRFTPDRDDFRMTKAEALAIPGSYLCTHCEERGPGIAQMTQTEWDKLPSHAPWIPPAGWSPSSFPVNAYPEQAEIDVLLSQALHGDDAAIQSRIFINPVATVDNWMIMRYFFPVHKWLELYQAYRVTGDTDVLELMRESARHYNTLSTNYLSAAQYKARNPEGMAYMYTMAASAKITLQLALKHPGQVTAGEIAEAEDFLTTIVSVLQPICEDNNNLDPTMGIPQPLADDFRSRAFNRALNGIGTIGMATAALEDLQVLNSTTVYQSTIDRYRKVIREYVTNWKNTGFLENYQGDDYFSYPYSATDNGYMDGDVKLFGADDKGHFSHAMQGAYLLYESVPEEGVDDAFMTAIANTIHFNMSTTSGSPQTPSQEAIRPYSRHPWNPGPSSRFYLLEAFKPGTIDAQCSNLSAAAKETSLSGYESRLATFNAQYLKELRQDSTLIHMGEESVAPPAAPTGLSGTGSDGQVSLDWDDNDEGDLAGYSVYRSESQGSGYQEIASSLSSSAYTDTNVVNDTIYFYVVTASDNDGGVSANSSEIYVAPFIPNGTAPATPTALSATSSDGSVSLDWLDNGESDLNSYKVYRSETSGDYSGVDPITGVIPSEYIDTDVVNGTTYYYVVTALDHSGNESGQPLQISAVPQAFGPAITFGSNNDGFGGFGPSATSGTEVWSLTADSLNYAFGLPGIDEGQTASLLNSYTLNRSTGSYTFEGVVELTAGYGDDNNRVGLLLFNTALAQTGDGGGLFLRLNTDNNKDIAIASGIAGPVLASTATGVSNGDSWIGQTLTFTAEVEFINVSGTDKIDVTFTLTDGSLNTYVTSAQVDAALYTGSYCGMATKWRQRGSSSSNRDVPAEFDYKSFVFTDSTPIINEAPSFTSDPIFEVDADEGVLYSESIADNASDSDSDPLTFSKVSGPAWLTVVADGDLSGTPPSSDVGLNSFTVSVSDGIAPAVQATLEINVIAAPINQAPAFSSDPIVEVDADEDTAYSATLTNDASDPESDPMTFSKVSGPAWLNVAANGALSGTPGSGDVGLNSFSVQVNATGGSDTATLEITVDAASTGTPSTITYDFGSGTDTIASAGLSTYVENTGVGDMLVTDDPGDGNVGIALYNEANSIGREAQGFYRTFNGLGLNDTDDFVITATFTTPARNWNQPVIGIHLFGDTTSGSYWDTGLFASVDAAQNLEIWSDGVENGSVLNSGTISEQALVTSTTTIEVVGTYGVFGTDNLQLVLTVSTDGTSSSVTTTVDTTVFASTQTGFGVSANSDDDNRFVVKTFSVEVQSATSNQAPTFTVDPIVGASANEDGAYSETLADDAMDPESDPITFSKVSGPAWLSVASNGDLSGTPLNSDIGLNSFTVEVSDGNGGTDSATLEITVTNVNDAPVFGADPIAGADATEDVAYTGSIAGSASDIDAGDSLSYSKTSGPAWLSVAANGDLSGTPGNGDVGLNSFTVVVSDGNGGIDSATLEINVVPEPNSAPVVNAGADVTVEGEVSGAWTPASLTIAGWYDAADAATITESGGLVSAWADKSGNGLDLTQSVSGSQPQNGLNLINGLNTIKFDGSNDSLNSALNPFGSTINDGFVIVVHRIDSTSTNGTLFTLSGSTNAANRWQAHAPWGSTVYFDTGGTNSGRRVAKSYGVASGDILLAGFYGSTTDNVQQIFKNGALFQGDTTGHAVATAGNLSVGSGGTAQYQNTSIGEFIVIDGTVSASDRELLEGYLAHKWSLVAELPASHPYKTNAPGGQPLVLNLDGSAIDPDEDELTTLWSQISGPAAVTFGDATAVSTTASFTEIGTYVLRLTADDGEIETSADVTITIQAPVAADVTPPDAPENLVATAGLGSVSLDWTDNTEEDFASYSVYRSEVSGQLGQEIGSDLTNSAFTDSDVTDNVVYYYSVTAWDETGNESDPSFQESALPGLVTNYVTSEILVDGTVSGTAANLDASDDSYQVITEVSDGTTSLLEHVWVFDVTDAEIVTFYVEAHHSANTEGDDFIFSYSTDDVNYTQMLTVTKTSDDNAAQYYTLPSGLSGTVYVRVHDADATPGNTQLDSLTIDELVIESETSSSAPTAASQPAPVDGATNVDVDADLAWTAGLYAASHDVYFGTNPSPTLQGNQAGTSYEPGILLNDTTYYWSVSEVNATGTTSGPIWSFTTATGLAPDVLHWTFDEGSGSTATDGTGNARNGLISGAVWTTDTPDGSAYALDFATGDLVEDGDAGNYLNGLDAVTVALWVKSDQTNTDKGYLLTNTPTGSDERLGGRYDAAGWGGGGSNVIKSSISTTGGTAQLESASGVQSTAWQHIALTWADGGSLKLYIDGVETVYTDAPATVSGTLNNITTLMIGKGAKDGGSAGWSGLIDDVRIYSSELTSAEIQSLAQ